MLIRQYKKRPETDFAPRPRCGDCEYYAGDLGQGAGWCHANPPVVVKVHNADTGGETFDHVRPEVASTDVHCKMFEYRVVAGGLADLAAKGDAYGGPI